MSFVPKPFAGGDLAALTMHVLGEMQAVSRAMVASVDSLQLNTLNVAPSKPRAGMVVRADGTHWNPGSGAGFYGYSGSAWTFLG